MTAPPVAQGLVETRAELTRACDLLVASTPDSLRDCQAALEQAVAGVSAFQLQIHEAPGPMISQSTLRALRRDVQRARRLLESLGIFYHGWERILGAMSGGYTANGDPAPLVRLGRLDCRG